MIFLCLLSNLDSPLYYSVTWDPQHSTIITNIAMVAGHWLTVQGATCSPHRGLSATATGADVRPRLAIPSHLASYRGPWWGRILCSCRFGLSFSGKCKCQKYAKTKILQFHWFLIASYLATFCGRYHSTWTTCIVKFSFFWQKSLRTIHTYHQVPFKLPKNIQRGLFQGLLVL